MTDLFTSIPNALNPQKPAPDTSLRDALAALRCVDCGAAHPSFGEHVALRHGRIGEWRCWPCWRMGQPSPSLSEAANAAAFCGEVHDGEGKET